MSAPPPPNGQVLSLVAALSDADNHELHLQAIKARDEAFSASPESYGNLCFQLGCLMAGADRAAEMLHRMDPAQVEAWRQSAPNTALQLQQNEALWIPFGQMAGLVLKQALLRPPITVDGRSLSLVSPAADQVKEVLLYCLGCQNSELRAVASSVIATSAVSADSVQPALYVLAWPGLMPQLMTNLQQPSSSPALVEGSLSTVRKMMEDGPHEMRQDQLDALIPVLIRFLSSPDEKSKVAALQSIVACLTEGMMPSALVAHFGDFLAGLSALATDPSVSVRKWVCRTIVTLLSLRTEYVAPHMAPISQFMLQSTADISNPSVALEACEFWLTFASLEEDVCTPDMVETVADILPQLVPILLRGMVYSPEQQEDFRFHNDLEMQGQADEQIRPVFHKSRAKRGEDNDSDGDDDDDDDDDDDEEGNAWTLRKCSAASLDSLAGIYGSEQILPALLPVLEEGLSSSDPWVQEASILALGAIAEGCEDAMISHMGQLHPYLMRHLSVPETPDTLPQVKSTAAWTIGRYSTWAVEQVQSGTQGHLLAQMTEVFLARLSDHNRRVQTACCSAFGVMIEAAGDLMAPYLEPTFQALVSALSRYQSRSLLVVLDTFGIIADFVGPSIGEGTLPGIYIPPIMQMWDNLAKHDPTDRTLLPLMESLSSIALVCGTNFQPFALETFDNAMCLIESVTLILASSDDQISNAEDADPIVCAADLLDGLVEGLGANFATLVSSSQRYGPYFPTMLHALTRHEIPGVRMSAFALMGDIARNAPALLETALPALLKEAIECMDPIQPSVCNNAVWAVGEVCVRCGENSTPLEPFVPSLIQALISLLMGNGVNGVAHGVAIAGLAENASATTGRLAKVNPNFLAADLPRFLFGWCDGMAKITDQTERKDAYEGFIRAVYANPSAIQTASRNPADTIASILFAVVSWHLPSDEEGGPRDLLHVDFRPFPPTEAELGSALRNLLHDIKSSVGEETWETAQKQVPPNVRRLLRDAYEL